jgi:hypothetical protein
LTGAGNSVQNSATPLVSPPMRFTCSSPEPESAIAATTFAA